MTRPMTVEFNVETQEEIIREMNDIEYANHLILLAQIEEAHPQEPDSVI